MSTLEAQLDEFISSAVRLYKLDEIARLKRQADETDARLCGNCEKWMKSRICPREHNVNGRRRGPSMNQSACGEFVLEQWVAELKAERLAAIEKQLKTILCPPAQPSS